MKISFVIPSYNSAAWLPAAVDSCRKQTHKDVEIVVVNDGSTDSTAKYLHWLYAQNDERVKIVTTSNQGRSMARNLGNMTATGEVICVLDADDISYPKRAEIVAREFDRGADFLYGSAAIISAVGKTVGGEQAEPFNKERALSDLKNRIVHSTVAYRKELAQRFPYRQEFAALGLDDWALEIEVALSGVKLSHVPNALAVYRSLATGISKTRDEAKVLEAKKAFLERLKVPA